MSSFRQLLWIQTGQDSINRSYLLLFKFKCFLFAYRTPISYHFSISDRRFQRQCLPCWRIFKYKTIPDDHFQAWTCRTGPEMGGIGCQAQNRTIPRLSYLYSWWDRKLHFELRQCDRDLFSDFRVLLL